VYVFLTSSIHLTFTIPYGLSWFVRLSTYLVKAGPFSAVAPEVSPNPNVNI
jgi:hypothetical protein